MISSLSIVFLATCYFYFKQYYIKLIDARFADADQHKIWTDKLYKKLKTLLFAIVVIVVLYSISTLVTILSPTLEDVKFVRRITDLATVLLGIGLFYMDKRELDTALVVKQ